MLNTVRQMNYHEVVSAICNAKNASYLNEGWYGSVFNLNKKPEFVLKVFRDPAYLHFIKWVMENQHNKYLPKVKGKLVRVSNDETYAVRIERLEYADNKCVDLAFSVAEWACDAYGDKWDEEKSPYPHNKDLNDIAKYLQACPFKGDMHEGNVMMRKDGTMVITDPVEDTANTPSNH